MATIYISEAEAVRDFAGVMAHIRAGAQVVIESDNYPVAVIHTAVPPRRSISESITLVEARSQELGYKPIMDARFAADMDDIVSQRKPRNTSAWE